MIRILIDFNGMQGRMVPDDLLSNNASRGKLSVFGRGFLYINNGYKNRDALRKRPWAHGGHGVE